MQNLFSPFLGIPDRKLLRLEICELGAGRIVAPSLPPGSVDGNTFSDYRSRNFKKEVAGRIKKIERERTRVSVALVAKDNRLIQVDRAEEISTCIIIPDPVSELERLAHPLPRPETDISCPWIDIRVVSLGPASIPDLERLLDSHGSTRSIDKKTDVPKSNDGRIIPVIIHGRRLVLDRRL